MKILICTFLFFWCNLAQAKSQDHPPTPLEGYKRLFEGNTRYIKGSLEHPNRDKESRELTAEKQKPFAIVLGCSDSRAAPEIIFDQGIGDLFVVRVAGNVVGPLELASIEFSALYLGSTVLLVLGHENCGAVTAVLEGNTKDIEPIADLIAPAVAEAKTQKGSQLVHATQDNVKRVVEQLKAVPALKKLIEQKKFAVVGGYYELVSGKVVPLTPPPEQ